MALDPRRILIFRTVARTGSISAAARDLGWTQPAVSQHLNRLERDVGGPLLTRGPRGVDLTEAGTALLRRADVLAAELHAAEQELTALADLHGGTVRLAAFPSAAATVIPEALTLLAADHPGVEVRLEQSEPPEALAALAAGDVDLALVFGYGGAPEGVGSLTWIPLHEEVVHLVLPPGHPPVRALRDLTDAAWIGGCVRCRSHLLTCCRAAGFEPAIRHTTDDYVVVQNLVARGLGVTALPATALASYRHPGVHIQELRELGTRTIGLAHRDGAAAVPATAALRERLTAVLSG